MTRWRPTNFRILTGRRARETFMAWYLAEFGCAPPPEAA
jgi:hypothetical protein